MAVWDLNFPNLYRVNGDLKWTSGMLIPIYSWYKATVLARFSRPWVHLKLWAKFALFRACLFSVPRFHDLEGSVCWRKIFVSILLNFLVDRFLSSHGTVLRCATVDHFFRVEQSRILACFFSSEVMNILLTLMVVASLRKLTRFCF